MLRAEKEQEKEINALMRKAEIPDAQNEQRYAKGNRGSKLPEKLLHKHSRLCTATIRQRARLRS